MNVLDFKPSPKVKRLARQLLDEARKNEPNITNDVEEIAAILKAKWLGWKIFVRYRNQIRVHTTRDYVSFDFYRFETHENVVPRRVFFLPRS